MRRLLPFLLLAPAVACQRAPTFNQDVQPILATSCQSCHISGGIGPMPLITYQDALVFAKDIARETSERDMPPFHADNSGSCNTFQAGTLYLSDEEIDILSRWADAGAPEGEPAELPPPPAPETLTTANVTVSMSEPFALQGSSVEDEYRCFIVDPGLTEDAFLTAFQVIPGDPRVVHHMLLFTIDAADASGDPQLDAEALDAADPQPGYECFGDSGVSGSIAAIWAPSVPVQRYPANTGVRLPANRKLIMQVHYNYEQGVFPDQTQIALETSPAVDKEASFFLFGDFSLSLEPGQQSLTEGATLELPPNTPVVNVFGVYPHMHTRGQTLRVSAEHPNGDDQCMIDVPSWDFHWQGLYLYEQPLTVKGGDSLNIECGYNTMGETETIHFGEGTADEMCLAFLYITR